MESAAAQPKTARDALIHDLLGDVGKLHDLIKALPGEMQTALSPSLGALVGASKEAQATIAQLAEAQKVSIGQFSAAEKVALRDAMKAAMREEAGAALADTVRALQSSAAAHETAIKAEGRQAIKIMAIAALFGLLGAVCGIAGGYVMFGQEQAQQADFGRAVGSVWGELDQKAQRVIQQAREAKR